MCFVTDQRPPPHPDPPLCSPDFSSSAPPVPISRQLFEAIVNESLLEVQRVIRRGWASPNEVSPANFLPVPPPGPGPLFTRRHNHH